MKASGRCLSLPPGSITSLLYSTIAVLVVVVVVVVVVAAVVLLLVISSGRHTDTHLIPMAEVPFRYYY